MNFCVPQYVFWGGGGVNLILPHSGSQKRQSWDEVKRGKMRQNEAN